MPERSIPKGGVEAWLDRLKHRLARTRIWVRLPDQEPESGKPMVLPLDLARLLRRQSHTTGEPLEQLLPALLQAALLNRRQPDPIAGIWRSLTEREREVACLMSAGLSNRAIAARLIISRNTVRTHARRVVRKFGCRNRKGLPDLQAFCQQTR